jgi:hypothetical protein
MNIIKINLEKLHDVAFQKPQESAAKLLERILSYYNIKVDTVYAANPDIEKMIVMDAKTGKIDYDDEASLENCSSVIMLFDGYETAFTCIQ